MVENHSVMLTTTFMPDQITAAHSTIYPKRLALSAFSLFEEQAGFVVVQPLPLIFDPPLYILHFTEKQSQKML